MQIRQWTKQSHRYHVPNILVRERGSQTKKKKKKDKSESKKYYNENNYPLLNKINGFLIQLSNQTARDIFLNLFNSWIAESK